jgi:hypothetical protein
MRGCSKKLFLIILILLNLFLTDSMNESFAGVMELSGGLSFSRSNYSTDSYSWSRRLNFGIGYHFWAESEIEFQVQDIVNRTKLADFQDTTCHDQIFSVEWVQSLAPRDFFFRPYFKVGIGQLNRDASGTYSGGTSPPAIYDTITGVLGAGVKIHVDEFFSLRVEGSTYLFNGAISTAADNFSVNSGLSIYF